MPTEKEWVNAIIPKLKEDLLNELPSRFKIQISVGSKIPYAYEVMRYKGTRTIQYFLDDNIKSEEKGIKKLLSIVRGSCF